MWCGTKQGWHQCSRKGNLQYHVLLKVLLPACLQVPSGLEKLFASNYDLLLSIFNPEGWLDITYVDETHRVGRDDKGNVFYLERC